MRSGAYQNQRFDSRKIAKTLILDAVVPKFNVKTDDIIEVILQTIDPLVNLFFLELTSHMGSELDLAAQGIPDVRPWNALSLAYVKHKGNNLFWSYTHGLDAKTLAIRRKITSKHKGQGATPQGPPLISTLERLSGLNVFGYSTVRVINTLDQVAKVVTSKTVRENQTRVPSRQRYQDYESVSFTNALAAKLEIKLWPNFRRSQIPTIETALYNANVISSEDAKKLIGHKQHRPLIRPFMSYYSREVIPRAIEAALSARFKSKFNSFKVEPL